MVTLWNFLNFFLLQIPLFVVIWYSIVRLIILREQFLALGDDPKGRKELLHKIIVTTLRLISASVVVAVCVYLIKL